MGCGTLLQVIILGSMQSEQYFGPGDASQETQVFSLCTNNTPKLPPSTCNLSSLPTGNALGGPLAALLSHRQVGLGHFSTRSPY